MKLVIVLSDEKNIVTIHGIGHWGGVLRENMAEKLFKIELETYDLVSVYLNSTSTSM